MLVGGIRGLSRLFRGDVRDLGVSEMAKGKGKVTKRQGKGDKTGGKGTMTAGQTMSDRGNQGQTSHCETAVEATDPEMLNRRTQLR